MSRFVILEHDYPSLHWDLMLEMGEVLWTWRLACPPDTTGQAIAAQRIADHRRAYLDYEGPVSGGRGSVKRWDAGAYGRDVDEPENLRIRLQGGRVRGVAVLKHLEDDRWEASFS